MTPFRFLIFLICLFAMACKKEAGPEDIWDDNPQKVGTEINVGDADKTQDILWGRSTAEVYVNERDMFGVTNIYQVDLLTMKSSKIRLTEGVVMGRNFDNTSMVMKGKVDNVYGYYLYHFNTGTFSLLMMNVEKRISSAMSSYVNVSGNAVFYTPFYDSTACPLNSVSCVDWESESTTHFIDVNSKKIVPLHGKGFLSFSKMGKKTLLQGNNGSIYIFDNDKAMLVDSLIIPPSELYFDDVASIIKGCSVDSAGEVTIFNARTKDVIQKFKPSVLHGRPKWSSDGTKLNYNGSVGLRWGIGIYDLIAKKETIFDQLSVVQEMYPSVDNKKILYLIYYGHTWYIKNVQ
jgi:hypothetical protein